MLAQRRERGDNGERAHSDSACRTNHRDQSSGFPLSQEASGSGKAAQVPGPDVAPHGSAPLLTGELQYLADLIRALNRPWVARDPRGSHGLDGDALEVVTPDVHRDEAPRHSKPAYQAVEHITCVTAGLRHSGRDQRLTMPICRLVP